MGKHDTNNAPEVTDSQLNISVYNADSKAVVTLKTDLVGDCVFSLDTTVPGGFRYICKLNKGGGTGANIQIQRDGYNSINHRLQDENGNDLVIPMHGFAELKPERLVLSFPAKPTREQVCKVSTTFGGLYFNHSVFGRMPLDEAILPWLDNPADRQAVYQAKRTRAAIDLSQPNTHCLIQVPCGSIFYPEWGNAYSPDRFGALDATNNGTRIEGWFLNLIAEVIKEGFFPVLMSEEAEETSNKVMPLLLQALMNYSIADLSDYSILSPGWDGVFYQWPNEDIVAWAVALRNIKANVYLCLEFPAGKIPLGEGGGDYQRNGRMLIYDCVLGEYDFPQIDDTVWQICKRLMCPTGYVRPADEPSGDDDGTLPNYVLGFVETGRGRLFTVMFEGGVYLFVRDEMTSDEMDVERNYIWKLNTETVC